MCGFVARRTPRSTLVPKEKFAIYTLETAVLERLASLWSPGLNKEKQIGHPMTGDKSNLLVFLYYFFILYLFLPCKCHAPIRRHLPLPGKVPPTSGFAFLLMFDQFKKFSIAICICTHIRTCLCNGKTIGGSRAGGRWAWQERRKVGGRSRGGVVLEKVLSQAAKKPFAYAQGLRPKGIPTKSPLGGKSRIVAWSLFLRLEIFSQKVFWII